MDQSDYNDPTEPLEAIALPLYIGPPYTGDDAFPGATTVPAQLAGNPVACNLLTRIISRLRPRILYYHLRHSKNIVAIRQEDRRLSLSAYLRAGRRRSPLPGLVRLCFVLVQLILLARALCLLFGVQNTTLWLTLLFASGDLFVLPARWLAANINLSVLAGTSLLVYLEFLVAILAYGLFSRLLALLLRALLN